MKTVGEILKKARSEKKLTLDDIEHSLRIRKKFLSALEENAWEKLPSLPYIKGFLKNYSDFLDLNSSEMIAVFRRQYAKQERESVLPKGVTEPLNEPIFRMTPQIAVFMMSAFFILSFFGYLFIQYKSYLEAPPLTVDDPEEGEILPSENVDVSGKTDSDAVVSINNQKVVVSQTGQFFYTLPLTPGINTIVIESTGKNGKKKTVTRNIQIQVNQ